MFMWVGSLAISVLKTFNSFFPEVLCTRTLSYPNYVAKEAKCLENLTLSEIPLPVFPGILLSGRGMELCYYLKCAEGKGGVTSHSQSFRPHCTFPSHCLFLSVLGLHSGPLCAPWGAGSRATGWWQRGEDGIGRSSDKAWAYNLRLVGSSGWEKTVAFLQTLGCHQSHTLVKRSQLSFSSLTV